MTDYIIYGFTMIVAGLMVGIRYRDYSKHKKVIAEASSKAPLVQVIRLKGTRFMLYLFIAIIVLFSVLAFFNSNILQSVTYIIVFIFMLISEWFNIMTVDHVSVFEKSIVYGSFNIRLKSIRSIQASGKKNMGISMLDTSSFTVPNEVGEKILQLQKSHKSK